MNRSDQQRKASDSFSSIRSFIILSLFRSLLLPFSSFFRFRAIDLPSSFFLLPFHDRFFLVTGLGGRSGLESLLCLRSAVYAGNFKAARRKSSRRHSESWINDRNDSRLHSLLPISSSFSSAVLSSKSTAGASFEFVAQPRVRLGD